MPELPDVEGFRRELVDKLPGRRVRRVEVRDAGVLRNTTGRALARNLADRGPARRRAVLAAVADAGAGRPRPSAPSVRRPTEAWPHRRAHLGVVPSLPTRR